MIRDGQNFWDVPSMWTGDTVVIIGGGPSLKGYDWDALQRLKAEKNFRVIGINDAFREGSWVDICFFGDDDWWLNRRTLLTKYKGICVSLLPCNKDAHPRPEWVKMLRRDTSRPFGITNAKTQGRDTVAFNTNSGTAAVGLAVLLGCKKIILLGFDMDIETDAAGNEIHNYHEYHSRQSSSTVYSSWRAYWANHVAKDLKKRKIECLAVLPSRLTETGIRGVETIESAL